MLKKFKEGKKKNKHNIKIIILLSVVVVFLILSGLAAYTQDDYYLGQLVLFVFILMALLSFKAMLFLFNKVVFAVFKEKSKKPKSKTMFGKIYALKLGYRKFFKHKLNKKINGKKQNELILPLYFGWEIAVMIRRIKNLEKHIVGPFKKYWQYMTAVVALIALASTAIFLNSKMPIMAATYTFTQSAWNSLTANTANHTSNQSGWTEYSATSTSITASSSIMIALTATSTAQTDDGSTNTGFNLVGRDLDSGKITVSGTGNAASVQLSQVSNQFGNGGDGAITISTSKNINSDTLATGRSCADGGDGVSYSVSSITSSSTLILSASPSFGCLAANDVVLLINLQGDGTNVTNVGNYEFLTVQSVSSNSVVFTENKTKYYGDGASDDTNIGTATTNQRVVIQRVPQYTNVTIQSGGTLATDDWDGTKGGVLVFYANGTVDVQDGGSISAANKGYRYVATTSGHQGESYGGVGSQSTLANLGGGGGSPNDNYCGYDESAGGGGYGTAGTTGGNSGGTGGNTYGDASLVKIYLGSAGGITSIVVPLAGDGGGIIFINADTVSVSGTISNAGQSLAPGSWAGGGGSGGSVYLSGSNLTVGTTKILATGGNGGTGTDGECIVNSGAGGVGRIFLESNNISGTTSPAATEADLPAEYYSSGTFTSGVMDTGQVNSSWGNLSWTETGTGTITLKARTCSASDCAGATDWASCSNITSGSALSDGGCATAGHRYAQYQAALSTADTAVTPSLDEVTIGYNYYSNNQTLTSSWYNSTDSANILGSIAWSETLPADTDVKFQIQTAPDSGGSPGTATGWMGTDGTNGTYFTDYTGGESLPAALASGGNDQWFQYKVFLESTTGQNTPTLSDITLTYVVNAAPEVQGVIASTTSAGVVSFSYEVRDSDTDSGTATPYEITPSFQYSTNGGGSWSNIISNLSANATSTKTVATSAWNTYYAEWTAKNVIDGTYSTNFQIKVIVNDNEAANNIASSTSSNFTVDLKDPVLGSPAIYVIASTTPASLVLSASDDSSMQMMIGLASNLSGSLWESYSVNSAISLATDPDVVYVRFRDAYGNTTAIQSATTPDTPANIIIRDVSNLDTSEFQEFISWQAVTEPNPGFASYNIWSSTDGSNYSLLTSIGTRATNYYLHAGLSTSNTYYYKVVTADSDGNTSYYSSVVSEQPDGQGGTDTTPPTISNVEVTATTTQSATIVWDTNELSNSTVGYSTSAATFDTETGVATYVDNASGVGRHSVTLTGLTPNTTYYFQVKSIDPEGSIATDSNGGDGYSFSTKQGPVISNVTEQSIENTQATIVWTTDLPSDSNVVYSVNSNLSSPTIFSGSGSMVTSHSETLTGLSEGTTYYYYVKSTDGDGNIATTDYGSGYNSFTTNNDSTAPVISSVSAGSISDTGAAITWITNERATSGIQYGAVSGAYDVSTTTSSNYNLNHASIITGLSPNTVYYYLVSSTDINGNSASGSEQSFTTLEELSEESEVVARETAANTAGANSAQQTSGGGVLIIDKTDKTAPMISEVEITELKAESATVSWKTDEEASSFVEYGTDENYGQTIGQFDSVISHSVVLRNLFPAEEYHFRALSMDDYGNIGKSVDFSFSTISLAEELIQQKEDETKESEEIIQDENIESALVGALKKAMDLINGLAGRVSLNTLEAALFTQKEAIDKLSQTIPGPMLSGEPKVTTTATTATIEWKTDKEANSLVAVIPEYFYNASLDSEQRYRQTIGNSEVFTTNHKVVLNDLVPNTTYHYQVKSRAAVGVISSSDDFVFITKMEALEIINYRTDKISNEEAVFKWATNIESDSKVVHAPYRNNILAIEEAKTVRNDVLTPIHEIRINNFEAGVVYNVTLSSRDASGFSATREISHFSTNDDNLPPEIYQVKTDSAISQGKNNDVQTIISWMTNEPATSRVYYQKGFPNNGVLSEATKLDENYTKKHVAVITKFSPGTVYSFQVENIDSSGLVAKSKTYTILTPAQKETVFQIIMKNIEQTFGWVGKLGI